MESAMMQPSPNSATLAPTDRIFVMRPRTSHPLTEPLHRATPTARLMASAIASQEIEGFRLDPQAAAELREVEAGSLSLSDLRTRLLERYRRPSSVG